CAPGGNRGSFDELPAGVMSLGAADLFRIGAMAQLRSTISESVRSASSDSRTLQSGCGPTALLDSHVCLACCNCVRSSLIVDSERSSSLRAAATCRGSASLSNAQSILAMTMTIRTIAAYADDAPIQNRTCTRRLRASRRATGMRLTLVIVRSSFRVLCKAYRQRQCRRGERSGNGSNCNAKLRWIDHKRRYLQRCVEQFGQARHCCAIAHDQQLIGSCSETMGCIRQRDAHFANKFIEMRGNRALSVGNDSIGGRV